LNGWQAESLARRQIKESGYPPYRLPDEMKLLSVAARLANTRLARAMEALSEEGTDIRHLSSYDILDIVYGLDLVIVVRGVVVGIDVTLVDDQRLVSKQNKLWKLASLHNEVGIHVTGIWNPITQSLDAFLADLGV